MSARCRKTFWTDFDTVNAGPVEILRSLPVRFLPQVLLLDSLVTARTDSQVRKAESNQLA